MNPDTLRYISFGINIFMLICVWTLVGMKAYEVYQKEVHKWKIRKLRKLGLCGKDFNEQYLDFIRKNPSTIRDLLAHTEMRLDLFRKSILDHLIVHPDPAFQALIEADDMNEREWLGGHPETDDKV